MINVETMLKVADNSGAILVKCIKLFKNSYRIGAIPGQVLLVVVKRNVIKKHVTKKSRIIVKGRIYKALLLRSVKGLKRWGNFHVKCAYNFVILLNEYNSPYATRLYGPMVREIRMKSKYAKIISLARYII